MNTNNEIKSFIGTQMEAEFFLDKKNGKKYKALKKEYKKIRFLEENSEKIRLTDSEKSIIANRKMEIESIVSNWPTDIKSRFQNDTVPTTFSKSLPGSFRYEEITLPTFDRKEPILHTWEDEIGDWDFFPLAYFAQSDRINKAEKMADQYNSRVQSIYDNERKTYEKEFQRLKIIYDDRWNKYRAFMYDSDITKKMKYDMPNCYMKDVLKYLSELIKSKEIGKNIDQNQFPYRVSNKDKDVYSKAIERFLGEPRDLSPEEIAEIDEEAEKATKRFRKRMRENAKNVKKKNGCNQEFSSYQALADVLEHRNPETKISQRFKVDPNVEEAAARSTEYR